MTGRESESGSGDGGGERKPEERKPEERKVGRRGMRKQDWIAGQLRRVYDEALQEDIPADMMALLAKLDEKPGENGA